MAFPKPKLPYADNEMDTVDLYYRRSLYRDKVLVKETGELENAVLDLWGERNLYGKINHRGDFIIPKENLLSFLQTKDGATHLALGFVAKAFNELVETITKESIYGNSEFFTSPYINFTVANGWESVYDKYHQHMAFIYSQLASYLSRKDINNKIKTFDDFVDHFFQFYDFLKSLATPLTLSGFVGSRFCSTRIGGLTIDISDKRYSNDKIKYNVFVNDSNFKMFQFFASNHGFIIDKNIPWRIVANLNSCYMQKKISDEELYYSSVGSIDVLKESYTKISIDYDFSGTGPGTADIDTSLEFRASRLANIFDIYYFKTYELDMKYLKTYLYQMYRSFIGDSPFYEEYESSPCNDDIVSQVRKQRKALDFEAESDYTVKDFWLGRYFMLRMNETDAKFSKAEVKYILFNAKKVYNLYGELKSLDFLNRKLKKRHKHLYDIRTSAPIPKRSECPDYTPPFTDLPRNNNPEDTNSCT